MMEAYGGQVGGGQGVRGNQVGLIISHPSFTLLCVPGDPLGLSAFGYSQPGRGWEWAGTSTGRR